MSDPYREMFDGLRQAAEALVQASEALQRAGVAITAIAQAALNARDEQEDLRETVGRLETLVLELVRRSQERDAE
jgi:hypothetical protein